MKTATSVVILTVLATLSLTAQKQDNHPSMDHQNHLQMMQMMKDSSMMDLLISHVATDQNLRMKMMEKLAEDTGRGTASMTERCAVVMTGKGEQAGVQEGGCCAMKHGTVHGTTDGPEKTQHKKGSHEKSPKH